MKKLKLKKYINSYLRVTIGEQHDQFNRIPPLSAHQIDEVLAVDVIQRLPGPRAAPVVRYPHDGSLVLLNRVVRTKVPQFLHITVVPECAELKGGRIVVLILSLKHFSKSVFNFSRGF